MRDIVEIVGLWLIAGAAAWQLHRYLHPMWGMVIGLAVAGCMAIAAFAFTTVDPGRLGFAIPFALLALISWLQDVRGRARFRGYAQRR